MPNWYVTQTNCSDPTLARVVKSTVGEDLSFVASFTRAEQWKRDITDQYNPYTPQERSVQGTCVPMCAYMCACAYLRCVTQFYNFTAFASFSLTNDQVTHQGRIQRVLLGGANYGERGRASLYGGLGAVPPVRPRPQGKSPWLWGQGRGPLKLKIIFEFITKFSRFRELNLVSDISQYTPVNH